MFLSFYSQVIFNWKCDWLDSVFEVLALPLEWRGCLNVQTQQSVVWCVKRRVQQDSGDRQGGRQKWFDVTRRPPTWHVDLAANTGVTPLNRPKNIDLSLLLHLLPLSSFSFLPQSLSLYVSSLSLPPSSHLCHSPPSVSLPLSFTEYLSLTHPLSPCRQLRLN